MTDERAQFENPAPRAKSAGERVRKILIVQTGSAGVLVPAHGDYPDWFRHALNASDEEMPLLRAHAGEKLSPESLEAHGAQGIIVTGSPLSVTSHEAWMADLAGELRRAGERGMPILGVCFGHQLFCEGSGVSVVKNPRGREIGTVQVQLTEAGARDPLFAWTRAGSGNPGWAPDCEGGFVSVQATHVDAVYPIPAGATLLASNENTPVQALRFSETVASVQFHPELRPETMRDLIASRKELLEKESLSAEKLAAGVRATRSGEILRAFAEQVRRA